MIHHTAEFEKQLSIISDHLTDRYRNLSELPVTPTPSQVTSTIEALPTSLPARGLGTSRTIDYLLKDITPGMLQAQNGPRYFGFVIGGTTPAAQLADILLSGYDENVCVTLPGITAATAIEWRTLEMCLDLLNIPRENFPGRTITTGATGSNILGYACARDYLYSRIPALPPGYSFSADGPPSVPEIPTPPVVILAVHPHFSVLKAAALVGLGNGPRVVKAMRADPTDETAFDVDALEQRLKEEKAVGRGVMVSYGLGEVNTGGCGKNLRKVAELCRQYGAWLHVDAAFGGFASVVPELAHLADGMELADSLTLDGHKWLNVPYDCGLYFCRHAKALQDVLGPPKNDVPAYLTVNGDSLGKPNGMEGAVIHEDVPTPLYTNAENSRRFRAFPLFASLMSLGKDGYTDLIRKNCAFARRIAHYFHDSPSYDLLNESPDWDGAGYDLESTHTLPKNGIIPLNIVLFAPSASSRFAKEENPGSALTSAINATRVIYVSGSAWRGRGAVRIAISNWITGQAGDWEWDAVKKVFDDLTG